MPPRKRTLTIPEPEFQALVQEALDGLPDEYAKLITNVAVVVEEEPSPEVRADLEMEEGEDLLGLYQGLSLDKESFFQAGGQLPARISIYRGPILRLCRTRKEVVQEVRDTVVHFLHHFFPGATEKEVVQEVRDTVVHEIGHHFGFDDDEMPY